MDTNKVRETTDYADGTDKKSGMKIGIIALVFADTTRVSLLVISSGAEGAVEKSLGFICLVTHQHQDPPNLGSIDQSGRFSSLATTSSAAILEQSHRERRDSARSR